MWPVLALSFERPFKDPVMIYALAMIIILIAPIIFNRIKIPSIIGLIVAGAIVGPNAVGLLDRDPTIILLGTVGLLYLMFLAGLEVDLNEFNKSRAKSLVFGIFTFALPQGLGTAAGLALNFELPSAILFGSIFASHTLLAYPLAGKLRISKTEAVVMAVGGTIITDIAALLVLAVVVGSRSGELNAAFWIKLSVSLIIYFGVVMGLVPKLGRWFFSKTEPEAQTQFIFVMAVLFVCSFLAEVAGVEAIIGAFLAGLAINRLIPHQGTLMNRINFVGEAVFIPFFLFSVGMLVNMQVIINDPKVWLVAAVMCACVLITKFIAAKLAQLIFKFTSDEGNVIFGLTVPQAAATLAATIIGFNLGLFDEATVNGTIAMILVTCIVGPFMVQRYGERVATRLRGQVQEVAHTQRLLVPISRPDQVASLMEVALLLRHHETEEPIFPISVLDENREDLEQAIAAAERMLDDTIHHGAAADVAVSPMTRTGPEPARIIVRSALERRISDVIVAWNGRADGDGQVVLGPTLDVLLVELRQQLIVCHIKHALNTTSRVVAIVPPGALKLPGIAHTGSTLKKLCQQVGASLTLLTLQDDEGACKARFEPLKPEVTTTYITFAAWDDLLAALTERMDEDDLGVIISPRPGAAAWSDAMATLPARLPDLLHRSFMLCFPATRGTEEAEPGMRRLDEAMTPARLLLDLGEPEVESAIRSLLYRELDQLGLSISEVTRSLLIEGSPTLAYGQQVLVLDASLPGLTEQAIFVARRLRGFAWSAQEQARPLLIAIVLSPRSVEPETHRRLRQDLLLAIEVPGRVEQLARAYDEAELLHILFPDL